MITEKRSVIYLIDNFYGTLKKTNLLLVLYLKLTIFLLPAAGIQKATYFRMSVMESHKALHYSSHVKG